MRLQSLLVPILATSLFGLALAATQWTVQPKDSKLTFSGNQGGVQFDGRFDKFTPDIKFDPADLAGSRFDVKIDVASVTTNDAERDDAVRSDDLFAVKKWPTATYVTEKFTAKGGNSYTATGKLTLRNVTRDVPIAFTFETRDGGAWLKGTATLKRLDFGVGQGDYKSTDELANEVKVQFVLLLKK